MKKALAAILAVVITLSSASALTTGAKEKLIGDVNFDKTTNVADATIVQQICADMIVPTKEQKAAADADGNGIININDATHIQMIAAEMLPETIDEPDPTEPLTPEQLGLTPGGGRRELKNATGIIMGEIKKMREEDANELKKG